MNRRQFLRVGALFVPAVVVPRVAYSFIWAPPAPAVFKYTVDGSHVMYFPAALYAAYLRHVNAARMLR